MSGEYRPERLPVPASPPAAVDSAAAVAEPVAWDREPADAARPPALRHQRIALVDLLDRVLAGGVVVMGEVRLAIADVDLVTISLHALISSVSTAMGENGDR